jgi:hypothetical protein
MTFWGRMKVLSQLLASLFVREEISKEEIEKLKESECNFLKQCKCWQNSLLK